MYRYLDYNASYPSPPAHIQAVAAVLCKDPGGNPSSIHHYGRSAKLLMEEARANLAKLLGSEKSAIIFTSGASEANNLVVAGVVAKSTLALPEVVYSAGEHPSLIEPILRLLSEGRCTAREIPLTASGEVDEAALLAAISPQTVLAAICHVQGEVGCCNSVNTLARRIKKINPHTHVHVDGVQGFAKLPCSWVGTSALDSYALSGHKIGAFKGIGALWLRPRTPMPGFIVGGGQEHRLRSGTENIPGIVSLGLRAAYILAKPQWLDQARQLTQQLRAELGAIPGVVLHGEAREYMTTVNFHVSGKRLEGLLLRFDMAGVCISSGTACASGDRKPSRVLLAMGLASEAAENSLRVSLGEESTAEDCAAVLAIIRKL